MSQSNIRGGCACGALRYEARGPIEEAHHCHCSVCRKFHGAAFATYARVKTENVHVVDDADRRAVFRSSSHVTRTFCRACGSSLFFAHDAVPHLLWIAAGTIDEGEGPTADAHVFVASKAPWWAITDAVAQHDEQRPEYSRAGTDGREPPRKHLL